MDKKGKLIVILCVAVPAMPIFGVETAKASSPTIEWTRNSTFVKSGYQWDPILYDWRCDFDGDGDVDNADKAILRDNKGWQA